MAKRDAVLELERIALTVEQAAAVLGINADRMGGMVRIGSVPHLTVGNRVLIGRKALEDWLTNECMANLRPTELPTVRRIRGRKSA